MEELRGPDLGSARAIAERRRRRRAAERHRRVRARRRNFLALVALVALGSGAAVGAGSPSSEEEVGVAGVDSGDPEVATVTGFHGRVPILMYHAIGAAPEGTAYPDLFVPAEEFRTQMASLARRGYNAVTLDEVFAAWEGGEPIAENPVVITFDDGLRSQYAGAFPVLDRMAWPAVLNLKVDSLDQGELTEEMVRELIAAGWEIDSHTFTHADVTTLEGPALRREIAGSRRELDRRFGVPVNFFCYPAGALDRKAVTAVKRAGYTGATTTRPGLASRGHPFFLKRIRVSPGDGPRGLAAKLEAS